MALHLPGPGRARLALMALGLGVAAVIAVLALLNRAPAPARAATLPAPVGIDSAFGVEQAAILAEMKVTGHRDIDGFRFWMGTIAGKPVVDVAGGELDESAELSSYILATTFHPRAMLFSGTAGAQNASVHVGDVVTSGFVVDKSAIHYYLGGYQEPYEGEEVRVTSHSDLRGAVTSGYGAPLPTPSDAATYGEGPSKKLDKRWVYVSAYAAPRELVSVASGASSALGTTTIADATGEAKRTGTITNKVMAGAIGQAPVWTEPLSWIKAQNMLYQNDAEENEGSGFAFTGAETGVPWLLVRGISDSVWYPNAYDGVLSSQHAATVVKYLVEHLPAKISTAPETLSELSPLANASRAGYLIAKRAYFTVSSVGKVVYPGAGGKTTTLAGSALAKLGREYTYAAGRIP